MTATEVARNLRASPTRQRPIDAEILQLLQEASQQYEECMRLADLADISEPAEDWSSRYAWDNPIGLARKSHRALA